MQNYISREIIEKHNLVTSFDMSEAKDILTEIIKSGKSGHGHMCENGTLYISMDYNDKNGYNVSLRWNLRERVVKVIKNKRFYPYGTCEDFSESHFYVIIPETDNLIQRALKTLKVSPHNGDYDFGHYPAFLLYCTRHRKDLI